MVVDHRHGVMAYVMVLHPKTQFGNKLVVDMLGEGCYLDFVLGCPPLPLNQSFRPRPRLIHESGKVTSRVDDLDFIKMNVEGPYILKVTCIDVPPEIKMKLQMNPLTSRNDFCLPTNCAYQFVFRSQDLKDRLEVDAYFAMEGLGLAVQLEHGILHHFMGAMSSHNTGLPVCRRLSDGFVTASNQENLMQIVGWGTCGGKREVSEAGAGAVVAGDGGAAVAGDGDAELDGDGGAAVAVSVEEDGGSACAI